MNTHLKIEVEGLFCNDSIAKQEVMFLLIAEIKQLCYFSLKCFEESSFTI